jgi:hypothetical protein
LAPNEESRCVRLRPAKPLDPVTSTFFPFQNDSSGEPKTTGAVSTVVQVSFHDKVSQKSKIPNTSMKHRNHRNYQTAPWLEQSLQVTISENYQARREYLRKQLFSPEIRSRYVLALDISLLKPLSLKLECCSGLSFVSDWFHADRQLWASGTNLEG